MPSGYWSARGGADPADGCPAEGALAARPRAGGLHDGNPLIM
ncbi:hypothetical protein [Streptomyces spectabilis]|nr:hypothetical protein [Streptomyces spectabilis]